MNHPFSRFLIFSLCSLLAVATSHAASETPPPTSAKAVIRSKHIKERIDSLFKRRLKPEPLPVILPNPFLVVGGVMDTGRPDDVELRPVPDPTENSDVQISAADARPADEPIVGSDAEILARYVGSLKIGGTVELNGQLRIFINQSSRKEGDLIFMDRKNAAIYVRIVHITPFELTLGFNEVLQTVRLKN